MAELSQARQENISLLVTTQSWALSWVFSVHLFHPVNNNPRHPWISKLSILVLLIDSLMIKNIKSNFTYYHTWNSFEQMLPSCWWSWKKFRAILRSGLPLELNWITMQMSLSSFFSPHFQWFWKEPPDRQLPGKSLHNEKSWWLPVQYNVSFLFTSVL